MVVKVNPLVIAHRGASAEAPENSLAAFRAALAAGADMIECDVQATADGKLVILHDDTLERTTTGKGRIDRITTNALGGHRIRDAQGSPTGEPVPSLTDALALVTGSGNRLLIERKAGPPATYAKALASSPREAVVVQSFDWPFLTELNLLSPNLPLGALGKGRLLTTHLQDARHAGASILGWRERDLDASAIETAHQAGFTVYAWTVNDPGRARTLAADGIDGVITDNPRAIHAALSA